jgi:hypothetical protein
MSLPYADPSLPSGVAPIFGDIDAARGDHLRANNSLIWSNLNYLDAKTGLLVSPVAGYDLQLYQPDGGASLLKFSNVTTGLTAVRGFDIGLDASEQGRIWNYENTDLVIGTNNTDRGRILAAGQWNIGTALNNVYDSTAGARQLLISKADASTTMPSSLAAMVIENPDITSGNHAQLIFASRNSAGSTIQHSAAAIATIFTDRSGDGSNKYIAGDLLFLTAPGYSITNSAPIERMRITNTGLVGIGVTPSNPLHVQSTTTPQVRIGYDAGSYATIGVADGGTFSITCGEATGGISLTAGASFPAVQLLSGTALYAYSGDNGEYLSLTHNGTNGIIGTAGTNAGNIVITNTTECTGANTGAFQVDGGADFEKHVNMQTNLTVGTGIIATTGNIVATAGYLKSGSGRWPSGSLHSIYTTENGIFDALSAYIPNINDEILLTGGFQVDDQFYVVNKMVRISTSQMFLYGVCIDINSASGNLLFAVIDNGGSTAYGNVSISW